jgi:Succinylglutamate desuccinylase / Aspartoacylase family
MAPRQRLSRRALLRLAGALPAGALLAACGGTASPNVLSDAPQSTSSEPTPSPTPPPPLVVQAGEQQRQLMAGTPQESPLYIYGSGQPGPVLVVLGGVHGNEPGGWQAAERIQATLRPNTGALLVAPRANKLAINGLVRTTDDLGDLNRLYPGEQDGLPMARMAFEIVETLREFHATILLDLHESWAFYRDRPPSGGTAYLGQTISSRDEPGASLARGVVDAVNGRVRAPHEEFTFREWPPRGSDATAPAGAPNSFGGSRSSLGLSSHVAGLATLLVEMGQQQALERRVALHVDVVKEVAGRVGL